MDLYEGGQVWVRGRSRYVCRNTSAYVSVTGGRSHGPLWLGEVLYRFCLIIRIITDHLGRALKDGFQHWGVHVGPSRVSLSHICSIMFWLVMSVQNRVYISPQ